MVLGGGERGHIDGYVVVDSIMENISKYGESETAVQVGDATYKVVIRQEDEAESPREWENEGTMLCWHDRYRLGDEQLEPPEGVEDVPDDVVRLPLYLYDHGGLTMSTSPFSCDWDSGQVGWIYAKLEDPKDASARARARVTKNLIGEVEVYDMYLRGEVYGYRVYKHGDDEEWLLEEVGSCWGFYGDHDKSGLFDAVKQEISNEK